ncbi:YihY family inner membrane protein [Limnohabitans sp. Rim11]|jgi:membrane protein|uniref:YihY family inner membrane protein n=1 Tax=Limnohabitans sp. Rim11 TaxID=1100719 RepID=UPI000A9E4C6A|nr:YihY family inner membrane protein [Limnohabitans sp. Rim11]
MKPIDSLHASLNAFVQFPWRQMLRTLWTRFREVRLGMTASSLTFTTVLALVPLFTLILAIFTAFPIFSQVQDQLQRWLIESLVPESISRQVLGSLTQFSKKASRLGLFGLAAVVLASVALLVTIDRTMGQIWRVGRQRPWSQRLLLYWAGLTLGPLLLGASLAISSYLFTGYLSGLADWLPVSVRNLLDLVEFSLLVACVTGLYYYLPNTRVEWRHALTGGIAVALGLELAKKGLAVYLAQMPSYSAIYGAFAAVPILLVWIYVAWVVVLLGAVITASLPEIGRQSKRIADGPGWSFRLALEILSQLSVARKSSPQGLRLSEMAEALHIEHRHAQQVLNALHDLKWIGKLEQSNSRLESAWVLLVDLQEVSLAPLMDSLCLHQTENTALLWQQMHLPTIKVADVIKT